MSHHEAEPNQYLVITGIGIEDMKIVKQGWVFPGQKCSVLDISPFKCTFGLQAMSAENLAFELPVAFTIGPRDDKESLMRYAKLVFGHQQSGSVSELVDGIITGESRDLVASMTIEDVLKGDEFKEKVCERVQPELDKFGLVVYTVNMEQVSDKEGEEYFSLLGQKKRNEVSTQAKIDIADANMKGEIETKLRQGQTTQHVAKIEKETKIVTLQNQIELKKEEIKQQAELQIFEKEKQVELAPPTMKIMDYQLEIFKKEHLTKAQIDYDVQAQITKSKAYRKTKLADADTYQKTKAAEAQQKIAEANLSIRKLAIEGEKFFRQNQAEWELLAKEKEAEGMLIAKDKEAEGLLIAQKKDAEGKLFAKLKEAEGGLFAKQKEAEGELFAKQKEAAGFDALADSETIYVKKMLDAFGGDYTSMKDYLRNKRGHAKPNVNADLNLKKVESAPPADFNLVKVEPVTEVDEGFAGALTAIPRP